MAYGGVTALKSIILYNFISQPVSRGPAPRDPTFEEALRASKAKKALKLRELNNGFVKYVVGATWKRSASKWRTRSLLVTERWSTCGSAPLGLRDQRLSERLGRMMPRQAFWCMSWSHQTELDHVLPSGWTVQHTRHALLPNLSCLFVNSDVTQLAAGGDKASKKLRKAPARP